MNRAPFAVARRGGSPGVLLIALPLLSNVASFALFAPLFAPGKAPLPVDYQRAALQLAFALLVIDLGGLLWVARSLRREGASLGSLFNLRRDKGRTYLLTVLAALPATLAADWLYLKAQAAMGIELALGLFSPLEVALWYAAVPAVAALAEEAIWRGYALPRMRGHWRGLFLTSLSFAAFHGVLNPLGLAATFIQGAIWGWACWRAGSPAPSMALHFLSRYLALVPGTGWFIP